MPGSYPVGLLLQVNTIEIHPLGAYAFIQIFFFYGHFKQLLLFNMFKCTLVFRETKTVSTVVL